MTTLPAPGGIILFGGAHVVSRRSADGLIYVVYCGERPNMKFGTYVYRILPDNRCEWVDYAPFTETRVDVSVEPDGMYLTYPVNRDRNPERTKVPGYITPAFPGGTHQFPPTPVTVSATDNTARDGLANLTRNVAAELSNLRKELTRKINELPKPQPSISEQAVRDIAWDLAEKRIYAELNGFNNNVKNTLETIIRRIIKNG